MANERAAILAALTASANWTALVLAINTKFKEDWGPNGLTPTVAPVDANGKLPACAVLAFSTRSQSNIIHFGERAFFRLWVYHDGDANLVSAALYAARRILDNKIITADNHGTPLLQWVDDMADFTADELSGAAGCSSRYVMLAGWY